MLFPGQVGWAKILPPQCVLGRNLSCSWGCLTAGCSSHEANLRPCIAFTFAKVEHTNNTFLDQCCIQTTNAMRQNNNVILQKKKLHTSSNYYCFGTTWCVAGSVDPFYRWCRDGIAMQGFTMSKRKLQSWIASIGHCAGILANRFSVSMENELEPKANWTYDCKRMSRVSSVGSCFNK